MREAGGQRGFARYDGGSRGPGKLRLRLWLKRLAGLLFQHGPFTRPLPGRAETGILGEGSLGGPGRGLTGVRDLGGKEVCRRLRRGWRAVCDKREHMSLEGWRVKEARGRWVLVKREIVGEGSCGRIGGDVAGGRDV